jgi:translation initiation factor eIF-2B subunit gamma
MRTQHRDAHIYIFPRWILDFIQNNDRLETLGEDVIGWWAKAGWQKGLAEKLGIEAACEQKQETEEVDLPTANSTSPRDSSPESRPASKSSSGSEKAVTVDKLVADMKEDDRKTFEVPPIIAYTHASNGPGSLIRRADTAPLLLSLSLQLAKLPSLEEVVPEEASPFAHVRKVAYPEGVKSRTTITKADCLIAENVTVEEKTSIKECVIGANSQVGEGAKLAQCLLMDGVTVGKGCKLTRCILGKRCVIGDGSILTDCEVQENLLVEPQSEYLGFTRRSAIYFKY